MRHLDVAVLEDQVACLGELAQCLRVHLHGQDEAGGELAVRWQGAGFGEARVDGVAYSFGGA